GILVLYMIYVFFFFFQAEDGIRDLTVTGVQTCALPISGTPSMYYLYLCVICVYVMGLRPSTNYGKGTGLEYGWSTPSCLSRLLRSEERRVGKECRTGGWRYHDNKIVRDTCWRRRC